ncbi:MAG: ATP synthase F1 subunit delta [Bacteroidetes bacterium GWF2_40_14]|nr:MAG: ATP synthase F1 subunit delta [Bacteroidetes bacterium GWF2_40_14]
MNRGIISTRYAKALLSYALERGREQEVYAQMKQLALSFFEVPDFEKSLSAPFISTDNKIALIRCASGAIITREVDQFIDLLTENKREDLLHSISLVFISLYNKKKNINICSLVTAVPITRQTEDSIKNLITDKFNGSVELKKSVEPSILGGFVFELNYTRLDASVATQLKRIREQFSVVNN